ncbi:Cytochrome c biogenesis protein CcsA [Anaerohalosphaera lusitana]|uniref:Cytochrome c biogenesis protein CcsA n=1 Tax=Anaerohalosphaera lusitana TaxID=1936003 RepID=A0A1U9NLQ0_9BACT|nr:cytochrome c biogenesis protein CcsA [Anaerohalosphaera lusitana]AQT68872.1 Cytochrome c biogenesis protein CcsA [Anaerohalosphaera lusitana]
MEIKTNPLGILIYAAMFCYLAAFVVFVARKRKEGRLIYALGFVVACTAFVYRWVDVNHVPMKNLFEVFILMGVCIFPITYLSKRFLGTSGEAFDMAVGFIVMFPAGFVFDDSSMTLMPALQSPLFAPHVATYMVSYIFMAKAACQAAAQLIKLKPAGRLADYERSSYNMVCAGFPLMTLGLLLGSVWGKFAWGDYWGWDPKELWGLISWLVYVGYLHWRYMYGTKRPKANSVWVLAGFAAIIITLLWVNLSRLFSGMHSYA